MITANAVLFSIFVSFIRCLTQTVTAPARLPQDEYVLDQDMLNLETEDVYRSNATVVDQPYDFAYLPASQLSSRVHLPRGLYDPLRKRNNYCFPDNTAAYCSDSNLCCTDTAENTGWCCWFTLNCDVENHDCVTPTVVFTSTSTVTSQISEYVTYYETSYDTEIVTETVTNVNVVTASNVETATVVDVTTVSVRMANRARHLLAVETAIPPHKPRPIASSTDYPPPSSRAQSGHEESRQNPITAFVEPSHGLRRRQAVTTTDIVYTTIYITTTIESTSTVVSTEYRTSTMTEELTTTSALDAQTTVHVTSTSTVSDSSNVANSPASSSTSSSTAGGTTLSQDSGTNGGGGGGLGGGAVAGIAVGAAAGAVILAGIISFCIYRNRKSRKAEAAMGAAPAQQDPSLVLPSSPPADKMAPAAVYDARHSPAPYPYNYYPVPVGPNQQAYHEADSRMLGWQQMYEMQHPPAELAAYQRHGMGANELPHDRG